VRLADGRPCSDRIERTDEGERETLQVVTDPDTVNPMSRCVSPTLPRASEMTGSNISTSLRAGSLGVSNVAHETMATGRS